MSIEFIDGMKRIATARRAAKEVSTEDALPHLDPKNFTQTERAQMFRIASSAWQTAFVRDQINTVIEPSDKAPDIDEYAALKGLRKYGLILKTAYLFFDDRQLAPAPLHTFVKELGDLNDNYFTDKREKHKERLRGILSDIYPEQTVLDFKPASNEIYHARVDYAFDVMRTATETSDMDVVRFHTARKETRHLMNIFQLGAAINPDTPNTVMFRHLSGISEKLGSQHDEVVSNAAKGIVVYDASRIQMHSSMRENLKRTLTALGA